jgi:hypothetical protein
VAADRVGEVLARFDGATTAKVKVAERGQSVQDDVDRVAAVRAVMGSTGRIRVDANAAWSVERAVEALAAEEHGREAVENALTRALRAAVPLLPETPGAQAALAELESASSRVGLARSFHNSAVTDTRALRRRRMPRLLRLAGHRAMPSFFDMDDTALRPSS